MGVARIDITPTPGASMVGLASREQPASGVHDPLWVTALVIDDGRRGAVLLACDLLYLHTGLVEHLRRRLAAASPLYADNLVVCCSHTHSGPVCYRTPSLSPTDAGYVERLMDSMVEAVVKAQEARVPARMRAGRGLLGIGVNRRQRLPDGRVVIGENPAGPVDGTLAVVQWVTPDGRPVAIMVNAACHPVFLGPNNRLFSADWVGAMRDAIEEVLGVPCLFIQGAAGDINPRGIHWVGDSWPDAYRAGRAVAEEVLRVCARLEPVAAGSLVFAAAEVWGPLANPGTVDEAGLLDDVGLTLKQFMERRRSDPTFPPPPPVRRTGERLETAFPLTGLALGDFLFLGLGAEPFTEVGYALKRASAAPVTLFAGYTNGCTTYLPSERAYVEGGYEVDVAPLFYGLPGPLSPSATAVVADGAMALLQMLGGRPRQPSGLSHLC